MRWIVRDADASAVKWREILAAAAGLTLVVCLALRTQIADPYGVPDRGDPLFSMWRLGWVAHQILADPVHLFDANIFHPEPRTLAYSESILLPALATAPLLWLGVPLPVAYTIVVVATFVFSGLALYVLARGVGLAPAAAWIGGIVFALAPYRFMQIGHVDYLMMLWMPLAVLATYRVLVTGRVRYAVCLALALAAQWYSSMSYGVLLTVYVVVFLLVFAALQRSGWQRLSLAAAGLAGSLLLAWPLAHIYGMTAETRGTRPPEAVRFYSARPVDYLQPHYRTMWYGGVSMTTPMPERELFPNIAPLALAASGLSVLPLPSHRLAIAAAGLVAFDGSLGVNGSWYMQAYERLDVFKSMRVPARFASLVVLSLSLLAASGAHNLLALTRRPLHARILASVLTVVCVGEALPRLRLESLWTRPPAIYGHLRGQAGAVLFEYPLPARPEDFTANLPYMYFSTWHWTRMINGYSGAYPRSYARLVEELRDFPLGASVAALRAAGVTHVTLHCALWQTGPCDGVRQRIDADARFRLVTETTWEGRPAVLYELK